MISSVLLNGTAVLPPKPEPGECLHRIGTEQITALYLVPTVYHNLVEAAASGGVRHRSVKKLAFAGAPMSPNLVNQCFDTFRPAVFVNQYGCTEMLAVTVNPRLGPKPLSAGRPALHTRIRIVTADRDRTVAPAEVLPRGRTGEVIIDTASPQTFAGYLNQPKATARVLRDGWYFTGDLGFVDDDGDLFLVGRIDDMIITGGENVFPAEIEAILLSHPGVAEAAVVGLPDERWGQRIAAFVVPAAPGLTRAELARFCLESPILPRFKRPRQFTFVKEIPKTATGKVLRAPLRKGKFIPLESCERK